jgi:phage shock protein A
MTDDLVKRLHSFDCITMDGCGRKLRHEAADRIEQLAATNEELEADLRKMALDCIAADGQAAEAYQAQLAAEHKLATCEKYKAAYAECDKIGTQAVRDLEAKLNKAMGALEKVQAFVRDLEPHADQGHTLAPALREACETLVELKQGA